MWTTPEDCVGHVWVRYVGGPTRVVLSVIRIRLAWMTCAFCREGRWFP